jgi:hypothetical protein
MGPVRHKFVKAYWPWTTLLNTIGCVGIVMPWKSIYYLDNWNKSPEFRRHELVHIAQIERLGAWRFSVLYLYYLARYGYRNNPLEIEAYGSNNTGHMEQHECTGSTPIASNL